MTLLIVEKLRNSEISLIVVLAVISFVLIAVFVAISYDFEKDNDSGENVDYSRIAYNCEEYGGTWIDEAKECEYVDQVWCDLYDDAEFNECGSACRHVQSPDGEPVPCTMNCVPYCVFEAN